MRKQQRKNYSGIRSGRGQTTLQSFLFKSRSVDGDVRPSATPEAAAGEEEEAPVCPPEPPKREIVRVSKAAIKEKASAFSSVGSSSVKNEDGEACGALSAAVFKGFHGSAPAARAEDSVTGDGDVRFDIGDTETRSSREPWKKRKSPIAVPRPDAWWCSATTRGHGRGGCRAARGPRAAAARARAAAPCTTTVRWMHLPNCLPRPCRAAPDEVSSVFSDASGGGWWHSDMEGVDGEEVGWTDDMWEGMGSVSLGGLEWH
ncbi:hypothetical protein PR202_gb08275 [Eleusine coracana subsp. coracana]|uniref:Uncharacterized protein n=1 Tax=Eleusine coracana subsp. coracana TaxID=191504 RepID=A0AAV5EE78_ELECO|nr:hypothetical protein PR202_gb08275 [Eleusine coracana subsp. coracana]